MSMFICDIEPWNFKYLHEYEVMLPCDLHALNENEFWKKISLFFFSNKRGFEWRKSLILQNKLWKCELSNLVVKWRLYS